MMKFREWLYTEAPRRYASAGNSSLSNFRDRRFDQGVFSNFSHDVPPWFTHRFPSLIITSIGGAFNHTMYGRSLVGPPAGTGQYIPWNPSANAKKSNNLGNKFGVDLTIINDVGDQQDPNGIYRYLESLLVDSQEYKKFLSAGAIDPNEHEDVVFDIQDGQAILKRRYFVKNPEGLENNG